ncbi:Protein of unknown function [Pyronema omphalodes CBS 100304]|uniref:Uncharacterized protein n=1 Tax=Pyronema omphalodes (strain CBS 100304) TaxID=1076935 RepID=U4LJZ1_PYROM|nr:Protein of unknown function [Pyronema omphalodes CBS 100304]
MKLTKDGRYLVTVVIVFLGIPTRSLKPPDGYPDLPYSV